VLGILILRELKLGTWQVTYREHAWEDDSLFKRLEKGLVKEMAIVREAL
jgi:hypothetical protein